MLSRPKEVPNRPRPQQQRPRPSAGHDDRESEQRMRNAKSRPEEVIDSVAAKKRLDVQDDRRQPDADVGDGANSQVVNRLDDEVENKEVISEEIDEKEGIRYDIDKVF